MSQVSYDENGFVTGFSHHDGFLDGVLTADGGVVYLALRAQSGESRLLTLRGVKALSVQGFREGNIVLSLRVLSPAKAGADAELVKLLAERLYVSAAGLSAGEVVFRLESSYGAEVLAVCTEVDIGQAGASLTPSGA